MKLNELFADDDAVSPVIGVILMVAITVILAAVITEPQAQFSFDADTDAETITVTHDGGQPVDPDNVEVIASSAPPEVSCDWGVSEITAGNSCTTDPALSDEEGTLRVTWESDDGSQTGTLADYEYDFTGS
ncbi:type IV pilin [Halobacteriales archaeon QS_1_69_70]|nr:MAG: type IV pilin [Halobacteriales archaeon QS_1_69_70]